MVNTYKNSETRKKSWTRIQ
uniref:Uncharacterized protein n=1 Tax=Arundo donax TaxID=35708 RepID=A0A0A9FGM8_ARUDO